MGQTQGKEFPYHATQQLIETDVWTFHEGLCSTDNSEVGVFDFKVSGDNQEIPQLVENAVKRAKTMRHPNMLRFIDSISMQNQHVMVTEHAFPLSSLLDEMGAHPDWIAYGLLQIGAALEFLHTKCKLSHGNISMKTIFITPAGEWKLGGLDFLSEPGSSHLLSNKKYSSMISIKPPEASIKSWKGPDTSSDAFQFGVLIYAIFNPNAPLDNISETDTLNIPNKLLSPYRSLLNKNSRSRGKISSVIKASFFRNHLSTICNFIENLALKENTDKDSFFQKLNGQIDQIPERISKYKLLPSLMEALDFGSANSRAVLPILKIGKLLEQEEYVRDVAPSVAKWFSSSDKTLRINLLQNLSSFADYLTPSLVNEKVFPSIVVGFLDPNPAIRELTIISMVPLVPKLSKSNADGILLKGLAKMQVDPEPGIRANATVCLSKVAASLSPEVRKRALVPAFSRALQDPFVHTRVAGILAFAATQQYFDKEDIAKRIIPVLSCCCIDPQEKVRKAALNGIKSFLSRLEFISENPDKEETSNKSGMFGWAVSSLSKFYPTSSANVSSTTAKAKKPLDGHGRKKPESAADSILSVDEGEEEFHDIEEEEVGGGSTQWESNGWDSDEQGEEDWNEDWQESSPAPVTPTAPLKKNSTPTKKLNTLKVEVHVEKEENGWGDDWEDFDEPEEIQKGPKEPKETISAPTITTKNSPKKSSVHEPEEEEEEEEEEAAGWGDDWGSMDGEEGEGEEIAAPLEVVAPVEVAAPVADSMGGWGDEDSDDWDDFDVPEVKAPSKMELAKAKKERRKND